MVAGALVQEKIPEVIIDFYQRRSRLQSVINDRLVAVTDKLKIVAFAAFAAGAAAAAECYANEQLMLLLL